MKCTTYEESRNKRTLSSAQLISHELMDLDKLKQVIRDTVIETYEELATPFHIIVLFERKDGEVLKSLSDGKWLPSGINDYLQRLASPQYGFEKPHVHIARKKHVNINSHEVAWNEDGVSHGRKTFNTNFSGIEIAKRIAQKALTLPTHFKLHNYDKLVSSRLILESIEYLPKTSNVFIFIAVNQDNKKMLGD